jgi:hypothetical protein
MKDGIISIGFDKNGEADFRVSASIMNFSLEEMNELRRMIPVAIGTAEDMFRRAKEKENPPAQSPPNQT